VYRRDTICAIATPPGVGALGIIRISGPEALKFANLLFRPTKKHDSWQSHHLYHGDIVSLSSGAVLDEVLLAYMKGPSSYTGEDTVEIYCHGGPLILKGIIEELLALGCRLAERGEFTKRAFFNNRLDLSQAEAVGDLIMAKTEEGRAIALAHLKGMLSAKIEELRERLLALWAELEIFLDFAEDDISQETFEIRPILDKLRATREEVKNLLNSYKQGKLLRDGAYVLIVGRPNVGKSSLLNALLGERRAIVTPIPGTTRDFIEESLFLKGLPIRLVDTAGLRKPKDEIEAEGIAYTKEKISAADLLLLLFDGSEPLTEMDNEIIALGKGKEGLIVINKSDLPQKLDPLTMIDYSPGRKILHISAKFGHGLDALKEAVADTLLGKQRDYRDTPIIANLRHKIILEKTERFLSQAIEAIKQQLPLEMVALDVRDALDSLSEVTKKVTSEELLEQIFSSFCIGK